jgi:hypothetical protein
MNIFFCENNIYFGKEGATKLSVSFCTFHLTRKLRLQENLFYCITEILLTILGSPAAQEGIEASEN